MPSKRAYHNPVGDPCIHCDLPLTRHRVTHHPKGDPCELCGLTLNQHRKAWHEAKGDPCEVCFLPAARHKAYAVRKAKHEAYFVGLDGEGQGRRPHRYVLLAASNESGEKKWYIEDDDGLDTEHCLQFLIALPNDVRLFGYSLNYDWTKILADLPDGTLYKLFRPELRQRHGDAKKFGPRPVRWRGFLLNMQGTKFTIQHGSRRKTIWDVFKFFQSKFVSALRDWGIGTAEMLERMSRMKDKRAEFDKESKEAVRNYCFEECRYMAELAHKLIDAHDDAGLHLRSFYGAGSTGGALLKSMGIQSKIVPPPEVMRHPVASAFFGGRFENSVLGTVEGTIYNYDISSAYPYQQTFLPCLVHGRWEHTTLRRKLADVSQALIRYTLGPFPRDATWGPFPFRTKDGTISYPVESGGGWTYRDEFLAAEEIYPHVEFREAWLYISNCDCQPFKDIPQFYLERLKLGKEGKGKVIKLGVNAGYGKLAQSVGNAPFNCWLWAGMITSGCRGQILTMQGLHKDWSNLLMIATDGIKTREKLTPPRPLDTGTYHVTKPLGGWEEDRTDKGVFFARPGIYFPLNPTQAELKEVKGRGVGKGVVLENWKRIIEAYEANGIKETAKIANVTRFCGGKSCISKSAGGFTRANANDGIKPSYGNWIARSVEMSFDPMPKREGVNADGLTLKVRRFPNDLISVPYKKAMLSKEARELKVAEAEMAEQPEGDFCTYE